MIAIPLLLKVDGKYVSVELTKITEWFADVVKAYFNICRKKWESSFQPCNKGRPMIIQIEFFYFACLLDVLV
jgi:hypothetical protein